MATSNPEIANFSATIGKTPLGETVLNISVNYLSEVSNMTAFFVMSVNKDKNDNNYEKVLVSSSTNVCKMLKGIAADILTKMIMEDIGKSADFELKCPIPKV